MYLYLIFHINKLMLWMNNCNSEISKDIFFMFFPQCENPNYGKSVCFLIFFFKKKSYFSSNRLNVFCSFYCCQTFWLSCSGVLNSNYLHMGLLGKCHIGFWLNWWGECPMWVWQGHPHHRDGVPIHPASNMLHVKGFFCPNCCLIFWHNLLISGIRCKKLKLMGLVSGLGLACRPFSNGTHLGSWKYEMDSEWSAGKNKSQMMD